MIKTPKNIIYNLTVHLLLIYIFSFSCVGTTELGGAATFQSKNYKVNSVGKLVKNFQLKIIEPETGKILGPNEKGEACFKTSFMMTEYYRNPEGTKKSIDDEGEKK